MMPSMHTIWIIKSSLTGRQICPLLDRGGPGLHLSPDLMASCYQEPWEHLGSSVSPYDLVPAPKISGYFSLVHFEKWRLWRIATVYTCYGIENSFLSWNLPPISFGSNSWILSVHWAVGWLTSVFCISGLDLFRLYVKQNLFWLPFPFSFLRNI